jgi:hypothetical protein
MTTGYFVDKENPPSPQALAEALGSRLPLWEQMTRFLADNYQLAGEWSYGGKNYGWNLWYRKGGKSLIALFPQQGYWVAQVILGRNEVAQALTLKLGKNVGTTLAETPQLHDGRWLFIRVKTAKDVKDIALLLQIKRRPHPQPPL